MKILKSKTNVKEQSQGKHSFFLTNQSKLILLSDWPIFLKERTEGVKSNKYTITPYFDTEIEYRNSKNNPGKFLIH